MKIYIGLLACLLWSVTALAHWRATPTGLGSYLIDVEDSGDLLYAVGTLGTILVSKDGYVWSEQRSGTTNSLNGISLIDKQRAVIVGDFGTILTTKNGGETWSIQPSTVAQNLYGVWSNKETVYLVGGDGLLLRSQDAGASWDKLPLGTKKDLLSIRGASANELYITGNGVIFQSQDAGKTWVDLKVGIKGKIKDITIHQGVLYAAGYESGLIHTSKDKGKTWTTLQTEKSFIEKILFDKNGDLLMLSGDVYRSKDGGKTWHELKRVYMAQDGILRADGSLVVVGSGEILSRGPSRGAWSEESLNITPTSRFSSTEIKGVWGNKKDGIYISVSGTGIFFSQDGSSWKNISSKDTPALESIWGASAARLFATSRDGLYLSTDKGKTWKQQTLPVEYPGIDSIWGTGDTIYLAGSKILASKDGGKTWEEQTLAEEKAPAKKPEEEEEDDPYAGFERSRLSLNYIWGSSATEVFAVGRDGQIVHTSDGGKNWEEQKSGTTEYLRGIWGSGADVFVVGGDNTLLHTNNKGKTWTALPGVPSRLARYGGKADFHSIWGSGDTIYIAGNVNAHGVLLHSTDRGKTWSTTMIETISFFTDIFGLDSTNLFVFSLDGEILRSKKGTNWELWSYPKAHQIMSMWESPSGFLYTLGERGEIRRTKDKGKTWESQESGVRSLLTGIWGLNDDEIFVSGVGGVLLATKNGGKTWELQSNVTEDLADIWGTPAGIFAVGDKGVLLSSRDKGKTWAKQTITKELLFRIWGTPDGKILYVGGAGGLILKSTDSGNTWSPSKTETKNYIIGIWGQSQDEIYAISARGEFLRTTNGGKTWASTTLWRNGLRDVYGIGKSLYVIGENGTIFLSNDGGATWVKQSTGTDEVLSCVMALRDGSVYIAGNALYAQDGDKNWSPSGVTKQAIYDLWSDGKGSVFASGGYGMIAEYNGKLFEDTLNKDAHLLSIFGAADHMYTVGYRLIKNDAKTSKPKGVVYAKKSGAPWKELPEVDWMLRGLWVNKAGELFAIGEKFIIPTPEYTDTLPKDEIKTERVGALLSSFDGGKTWSTQPLKFIPLSIWGDEELGLYISGENGALISSKDKGKTWADQQSNTEKTLYSLWGDGTSLFAVGSGGTILRSEDGKAWVVQRSNINTTLNTIWGNSEEIFAAGYAGVIVSSKDKGKTWKPHPSTYYRVITAVWGYDGGVISAGQYGTQYSVLEQLTP